MRTILLSCMFAVLTVALTIGCKPKEDTSTDTNSTTTTGTTSTDTSGTADADAKIKASLAKLSEADRVIAEKQKLCPVSDKPLGSMDTPVKVTVEGKDVFLCCSGCEDSIKGDPQKYLAKLPE